MKIERERFTRTREKGYADYGLSYEDVITLKNICRNADDRQLEIIKCAANYANSVISKEIVISLCYAKSYEKLVGMGFNVGGYSKPDFYAYRRKALAQLKRVLKNQNSA